MNIILRTVRWDSIVVAGMLSYCSHPEAEVAACVYGDGCELGTELETVYPEHGLFLIIVAALNAELSLCAALLNRQEVKLTLLVTCNDDGDGSRQHCDAGNRARDALMLWRARGRW